MAKWYLAAIMAVMGVTQLVSWNIFIDAIEGYDVVGRSGSSALGAVIILGELAAAVMLIRNLRLGALISVVVMIVWTGLAVQAFARGLSLDNCGCFGQWIPQRLRWWVLLEDLYLLGLSAWLVRKGLRAGADGERDRDDAVTRRPQPVPLEGTPL